VPGTVVNYLILITICEGGMAYSPFTDEKTETQRGELTGLKSTAGTQADGVHQPRTFSLSRMGGQHRARAWRALISIPTPLQLF
jgi:hypothetical protein